MSTTARIFVILDLFDVQQPFWTAEQIINATGFSRPSAFRYLKELCASGLLARFAGGYVLGAKAVKLDYIIRQSDPQLGLFKPIVRKLCDATECDVILATLLGNEFFAVAHEESGNATVSWSRGRTMPLARGAGGLAVLSALPAAKRRRLLARSGLEGAALDQLHQELKTVAKQGFAVSLGALEEENVGIAVPVMLSGTPPMALILVMRGKRFATSDLGVIVRLLRSAQADIISAYAALVSLSDMADQRAIAITFAESGPLRSTGAQAETGHVTASLACFAPLDDDDLPPEAVDLCGEPAAVLNVYRVMAHHPALLKAWRDFRNHIVMNNRLDAASLEIVILRTGFRRNCRYEWMHHVVRGRKAGLEDFRIRSAALPPEQAGSAKDALLMRCVDALVDTNRLTAGLQRELVTEFGKEGVLDLMATVGMYSTLSYMIDSFSTPIDEDVTAALRNAPLAI